MVSLFPALQYPLSPFILFTLQFLGQSSHDSSIVYRLSILLLNSPFSISLRYLGSNFILISRSKPPFIISWITLMQRNLHTFFYLAACERNHLSCLLFFSWERFTDVPIENATKSTRALRVRALTPRFSDLVRAEGEKQVWGEMILSSHILNSNHMHACMMNI